MAKQTIGIGSAPNDGTGDPLRTAFDKANDNFDELYAADAALGTAAALDVDPDDTLAANSDSLIPTQQAVKAYVDNEIAGIGASLPVVATDADDYTVLAADVNKYIRLTSASAKDIFVQDDATEALPANGEWHFRNVGAGDATFDDTDVTIHAPAGGTLVVPQGGTVTLKRVATDEFDLFGVTVPA